MWRRQCVGSSFKRREKKCIVLHLSTAVKRKWEKRIVEQRETAAKKVTLKCETKWGVFACNMGLGLFKRDQIIYNCVIIIIIIELRAHTNKRPLNDLKSIRENSFQFSDKCCSNQSRPTESDRFEWRIDDTENE